MFEFLLCLLVSSLFIFNSFLCGRLIKKYLPFINNSLTFCGGFFLWLTLILLGLFPLFLVTNINYKFVGYYLLALQVILIIFYLLNWRYSLMWSRIDYKKITFIIVMTLIIIGVLFSFKAYNNELNNLGVQWTSAFFATSNIFGNINQLFLLVFKQSNDMMLQYIWMLPYAILLANIIYAVYENKFIFNIKSFLICFIVVMMITTLSLCLNPNPSHGEAWLIPSVFLMFYLQKINHHTLLTAKYNYYYLTINFGLFLLDPFCIICLLVINLYFLYANYKDRINNCIQINLINILATTFILGLYFFYFQNIVGYVVSCLTIIIYLLYLLVKNLEIKRPPRNFLKNINSKQLKWWFYGLCSVFFILIVLITLIPNNWHFTSSGWVITQFLNHDLNNNQSLYYLVNISYWTFSALLFVWSIWLMINKKTKIQNKELIVASYITVYNPLATQFWTTKLINGVQTIMPIISINLSLQIDLLIQKLFNINSKYNWLWISLASSISLVTWLGLTLVNVLG